MKRLNVIRGLIFLALGALFVQFQNCTQTEFEYVDPASLSKANGDYTVGEQVGDGIGGDGLAVDEDCDDDVPCPDDDTAGQDDDVADDDNTNGDDDSTDGSRFACDISDIKDLILNIDRVDLCPRGEGQASQSFSMGDNSLIQLSEGFEVSVDKDVAVSQIRLVLNATGNRLIDNQDRQFALKTPSQQQSGLKLLVAGRQEMKAGQSYRVTLRLDLSTQLVINPNKCILKPVIRIDAISAVSTND